MFGLREEEGFCDGAYMSGRGGTRSTGIDEEAIATSGIVPPGVETKSLHRQTPSPSQQHSPQHNKKQRDDNDDDDDITDSRATTLEEKRRKAREPAERRLFC